MAFSERAKMVAMAIIKVFETGKPLGDYSAIAVLKDGAGISYGISQFTHKSGSLYAVLARFQELGGALPQVISDNLANFKNKAYITSTANSTSIKTALKKLGTDPIMRQAQREVAFEKYLKPSIKVCEGSGFVYPLSLAVIYDSKVHGSYNTIRDRVPTGLSEKAWIARYVDEREKWLRNHKKTVLHSTVYRPQTFRNLIKKDNWALNLPLVAHGRTITAKELEVNSESIVDVFAPETVTTESVETSSVDITADTVESVVINQSPEPETPSFNLPSAETIKQQIPRITSARTWLGGLGIGTALSTFAASIAELPPWTIFILGALSVVVFIALGWLFVTYYKRLFSLVEDVVKINADPTTQNVELVARIEEKE